MSTPVEIVESRAVRLHRVAIVDRHGHVWVTFSRPWWDLAAWAAFWLMPGKRDWVLLRRRNGRRARVRAVRIAREHVRGG